MSGRYIVQGLRVLDDGVLVSQFLISHTLPQCGLCFLHKSIWWSVEHPHGTLDVFFEQSGVWVGLDEVVKMGVQIA